MLSDKVRRYVPLLVWVIVVMTVIIIPPKIISYGYLPPDDALRHAAKAVSGKPWGEILVMRSDFPLDLHPGWHAILGAIYHWQNYSTETLVLISIVALALLVNFAALPWLRRPESWLGAMLAIGILVPAFINRLVMGRPFLFTIAVFITLLGIWTRIRERTPNAWQLVSTVILLAAATWIHGSFYLLILPAAGILLSGRWRQAFWFGGCWLVGSFLGASLTGHPLIFLTQALRLLFSAFGTHLLTRQLVSEFQPGQGDFPAVLAVGAMILWRARTPGWKPQELLEPIFMMTVVGWLLGLAVLRFWWEWGLPALLLWFAVQLQKQFEGLLSFESPKRLLVALALGLGLYLATTSDVNSRWTWNLTNEYLTRDNPELASWVPGDGGIIYSAEERVFYETFFKNPTAPWRYVLGFEAGLMRREDLNVMRNVYWNHGDLRAYKPWVDKMRPQDRLVIRASWVPGGSMPGIPELEWRLATRELWVGRPRQNTQFTPGTSH